VQVTSEKLENSLVQLDIAVEDDRISSAMDRAVGRISKQVKIPGFRPGKAPRNIIEQHVGKGAIFQEAIEELLPSVYTEAVEAESIDAIDQPEIELISTEPLEIRAIIPVKPNINLNDYESIRVSRVEVSVSDDECENALLELRRRFAVLEPIDRAVEWNDIIRADVSVQIAGESEPHVENDAEFAVREGTIVSLPGFVEALIGRERGGPQEFSVDLPEDFSVEDMAGKTANYSITIHEVKNEILPDADDEFAASLEEEFENMDALRTKILADLKDQKDNMAKEEYRNEIVDLLVTKATIEFPQVLIEREIDRLIDMESNHASHTEEGLNQWLATTGQTLEEVREKLHSPAELSVRRSLVLGEFSTKESIEVSEEQVDEEIDKLIASMGGEVDASSEQAQTMRSLIDTDEGRASMQNQLLTKNVLERLEEIASQNTDEIEGEKSQQPKRGRRRAQKRTDSDVVEETEDK
tara:strand:+ start:39 stop:1445 length:1407 start_codon:yes stop_codon:yes gene_type:complete